MMSPLLLKSIWIGPEGFYRNSQGQIIRNLLTQSGRWTSLPYAPPPGELATERKRYILSFLSKLLDWNDMTDNTRTNTCSTCISLDLLSIELKYFLLECHSSFISLSNVRGDWVEGAENTFDFTQSPGPAMLLLHTFLVQQCLFYASTQNQHFVEMFTYSDNTNNNLNFYYFIVSIYLWFHLFICVWYQCSMTPMEFSRAKYSADHSALFRQNSRNLRNSSSGWYA
jgi:hypothetical protein